MKRPYICNPCAEKGKTKHRFKKETHLAQHMKDTHKKTEFTVTRVDDGQPEVQQEPQRKGFLKRLISS